jgi:molybdopterin synthase catalytic subunit
MKTIAVELVFFAALRDRFGARMRRDVPRGTTVRRLWREIAGESPGLSRLPVRFAVREQYVEPRYVVRAGDEIAVFPPVSGGA